MQGFGFHESPLNEIVFLGHSEVKGRVADYLSQVLSREPQDAEGQNYFDYAGNELLDDYYLEEFPPFFCLTHALPARPFRRETSWLHLWYAPRSGRWTRQAPRRACLGGRQRGGVLN